MEHLSSVFGLVTDNDPTSENGQLFVFELILLKLLNNENVDDLNLLMWNQLASCKRKEGLYCRNITLQDGRCTSHDNMSAIMSWSYTAKSFHRKDIWKYLLTHLGTYDSSLGKSKQLSRFLPYNPANFFIWGKCAESKIYMVFMPFYVISLIFALNKPKEDTSGKLLAWVELTPHREHWLIKPIYNYFVKKMTEQYGTFFVKELLLAYFKGNSPNFPIFKQLT